MSKISYSTAGFVDRDVEAALDSIAAAGFTQAELRGTEPHVAEVPTGKALLDFRSRLESRGFYGCTVHAPAATNVPGAPEEGWRREKVEVLAGYIRFAGGIGGSGVVIHATPNPCFVPDAEAPDIPQRIHDAILRSLDDLIPVAEQAGTRMLLENLPYECQYPLLTMRELRPFVDSYPARALGLIVDTGHAWTMKIDPVEEIRLAGCRLEGTHLQDVDYDDPQDDHWVPTQGGLDWEAIRSALAQINYGGAWTFEPVHGRHGETPTELARICRSVAAAWGS
jgi:sugar phosphate isomerase/epimerase